MKTVLITGGSRGIGKAVAIKFAEKGNQIIINYVSEKTDTEKLKNELLEAGAKDVLLINLLKKNLIFQVIGFQREQA